MRQSNEGLEYKSEGLGMSWKLIENLSWIDMFLLFGAMFVYFALLLILFLLCYSGFDLASMSISSIEVTSAMIATMFIASFIFFGIALVLYLKKRSVQKVIE